MLYRNAVCTLRSVKVLDLEKEKKVQRISSLILIVWSQMYCEYTGCPTSPFTLQLIIIRITNCLIGVLFCNDLTNSRNFQGKKFNYILLLPHKIRHFDTSYDANRATKQHFVIFFIHFWNASAIYETTCILKINHEIIVLKKWHLTHFRDSSRNFSGIFLPLTKISDLIKLLNCFLFEKLNNFFLTLCY